MNQKNLSSRDLAVIKRIAQNVDADFQKVTKLNEKIESLVAERDSLQVGIDEMEAPVIRKTGGFKSTDIYKKVVLPQFNADGTPKTDKEGRPVKVTKYVLRYEETILPPASSNSMEAPVGDMPAGEDVSPEYNTEAKVEVGNNNPSFNV